MRPFIGEIVEYYPTAGERDALSSSILGGMGYTQYTLPAIVVSVTSDISINLQVFTDGTRGSFWKQYCMKGGSEGNWNRPIPEACI